MLRRPRFLSALPHGPLRVRNLALRHSIQHCASVRSGLHRLCSSGATAVAVSLCAGLIAVHAHAVTAGAYDATAAATRSEFSTRVAHCKRLAGAARTNCINAAKAKARSALGHTYAEAVAAAKANYASASARCRNLGHAEHHRCLKAARAERAMALGRAEEIRSAPLAMGMN